MYLTAGSFFIIKFRDSIHAYHITEIRKMAVPMLAAAASAHNKNRESVQYREEQQLYNRQSILLMNMVRMTCNLDINTADVLKDLGLLRSPGLAYT